MNKMSLHKINSVSNILSLDAEFNDICLIAYLKWNKLPEATKYVKTIIMGDSRVEMYHLGEMIIINVTPHGYFQIM